MDRIISVEELKKAISETYDKYKDFAFEGAAPTTHYGGRNVGKFGISLRLADGTKFDVGDTQAQFPLFTMARVPMYVQLLTQFPTTMELVKKMRFDKMPCACKCSQNAEEVKPKHVHAKLLRMASLLAPVGDKDAKMNFVIELMNGMMGSSPVLDDELYKGQLKRYADADVVNLLAKDGYELYDETPIAVDIVSKLHSMLVTTEQLAEMGATIAADGYNSATKTNVFDGSYAAPLVAMIAAKGVKKMKKTFTMVTGLPAMSSSVGSVFAVLPGFGSIAAYSPDVVNDRIPVRAVRAIVEIATRFGLNVFASARVKAE